MYSAFNDCLYRVHVLDNARFMAIVDFDEILVTFNETLLDFVKRNMKSSVHSFRFQNVFFFGKFDRVFSRIPKTAGEFFAPCKLQNPKAFLIPVNKYLVTQTMFKRIASPTKRLRRSKFIADVKKTLAVRSHQVLKGTPETSQSIVDPSVGLSFHYRTECVQEQCNDNSMIDHSATRFAPEIFRRVDVVCAEIFDGGVCS